MSKFEKYKIETLKRSEVTEADYNPRKITEQARKKLKKAIRQHGLVEPIIVNKQTGNVVGGHQRLSILDDLHRGKDYELNVSLIDVSEEDEVKINIQLNNPSVQGEWDNDKLVEIKEIYPDIDFTGDLGFEKIDLDYMFASTGNFEEVSDLFKQTDEQRDTIADIEAIKQAKKDHREKAKAGNEDGTTHNVEKDDYYVVLVFNNNTEKFRFMEDIKQPKGAGFVKAGVLHDIADGKIKLRA